MSYNRDTICVQGAYKPKNGEPRVLPIVQSTTYVYDSAAEVAAIFDDPTKGLCYSRFGNPTVMAVEEMMDYLEGDIGAARLCVVDTDGVEVKGPVLEFD